MLEDLITKFSKAMGYKINKNQLSACVSAISKWALTLNYYVQLFEKY